MSPPEPSRSSALPSELPRLTPLPDGESGQGDATVSLSGSWGFVAAPADEPPESDADWRAHEVPGLWAEEGYKVDEATGEVGWYRRTFRVPPRWEEGRVKLRFGAVYSDATIWVNGERLDTHEGGYTPFEVDLTEAVSPGENTLRVAVSEDSRAAELDWGNVTGGITRDVTLFAVPDCHLSRFHIETDIDGDRATVRALATVENEGNEARTPSMSLEIGSDGGPLVERDLDVLAAGEFRDVTLEAEISDPDLWTPESPTLYDVQCHLAAESASTERLTVTRRAGIRELEVVGNELRLNGTTLTLRGMNWEEVTPERGSIIEGRLTRADAERLRNANVNYVRPHTYPPTEAFLDACDELGIVVQVELPFTFVRDEDADPASDPDYRDLMCRLALETVQRDRTHPSVVVWSLANESDWGPNFEAVSNAVATADSTRPKTFNWAEYRDDDAEHCEVGNHHYPEMRTPGSLEVHDFEGFDRPMLFDEYAHVYCYNHRELLTDPGLRDSWGEFLDTIWDTVRDVDAALGAAVFSGIDHIHPEFRWGVIDSNRRERPEYWHVKKVYSPVRVTLRERTAEGVELELENRYDFRNLAACRVEWEEEAERGDAGTVDVDVPPCTTGRVPIPLDDADAPFTLRVVDPDGFLVDTYRFDGQDGPSFPDSAPSGAVTGHANELALGSDGEWTVDTETGRITGGEVIDGGLTPVMTPLEEGRTGEHQRVEPFDGPLDQWTVSDVSAEDSEARLAGYGDDVEAEFTLTPLRDGWIRVEYELSFTSERTAREVGFAVNVVGERPTLSWDREGYWTSYPDGHIGRESGSAVAFPDGERPSGRDRDPSRPWSRETTPRGSNDFRSCKRSIRNASLVTGDGGGVSLRADGDASVRAVVTDEGVQLLVLARSFAGSGGEWFDRNATLGEDSNIDEGTTIQGTVDVSLVE